MTDRQASRAARVAELRPAYLADLAGGTRRFFEPRRTTCSWCESTQIGTMIRTTDLLQRKPGRFCLDRCAECGHVFQNPRLNAAGLEFYYRDAYDGLGEETAGDVLSGNVARHRSRATAIKEHAEPATWLDVGTGHGHFPAVARELFPQTRFAGLDLGSGVELALQRGWLDHAHQGDFVELAGGLTESYDVVSMFHSLEHLSQPRAALEAALKVLRPGGHLIIEVPDPECLWALVLRRWWLPWLQPQHLNLFPLRNLSAALTELGFTTVCEQRGEPHDPIELVALMVMVLHNTIGGENVPWEPKPPTRARRIFRSIAQSACAPSLAAASLLDHALGHLGREHGFSNAFRIVAQKL